MSADKGGGQLGVEIEVKAYAADLCALETRLQQLGAVFTGAVHQTDRYFNHPQRDFAQTDEALRIRIADDRVFMTYKGRKMDRVSKTREEIEVAIGDAAAATRLLERFGFTPVEAVRKLRREYRLGEFTVCLDDVAGLGTFVEVERRGAADVEKARDGALALLEQLNLHRTERRSYLELLLESGSE
ncbi:MAG TPA: class IV adenylate cyclase [Methanomicrobia archaeon]|mgnify:CR=1 FL=1|nr:class IV adenylate cyclase [Methanomicrobia archaeon]